MRKSRKRRNGSIAQTIFSLMVLVGMFGLVGTIGASETNTISLGRCAAQSAICLLVLLIGIGGFYIDD